jgi:hypothetical protein
MISRSLKQSEGLDKRKINFVGLIKSNQLGDRLEKQRFKTMVFAPLPTQTRGLLPSPNTNNAGGPLGLRNRLARQS